MLKAHPQTPSPTHGATLPRVAVTEAQHSFAYPRVDNLLCGKTNDSLLAISVSNTLLYRATRNCL